MTSCGLGYTRSFVKMGIGIMSPYYRITSVGAGPGLIAGIAAF